MIYSVTGKLLVVEPGYAVVEAGGVGYKCTSTTNTLASLPPRGSQVTLLTHLYLREDVLELYGFATEEELRCFRMLITVSGVGPKVAVSILSGTTPQRLLLSIAAGDVKALKVPGVGPKIAQRIILELKDKVGSDDAAKGLTGVVFNLTENADGELSAQGEAIGALVTLGYSQTDAAAVVARLDRSLPADELIKAALKKLSRNL
ncbi:Holliday junction branch migration protein RuvA [Angelakisella massiliensis]|uniref:Holliday junction branch migration protein RuvA n=1 Tax=Angelakisella massiliensis TaxID=1871018 RepID=UPI0023A90D06|nr:Holliday junction branch migration protein RuvA [Angelakisella massiliensis]